MRYMLFFDSPYTNSPVDTFRSMIEVEDYCNRNYGGGRKVAFARESDGVLRARIYGDVEIVLSVKEEFGRAV